jgi:alpha-tubulin suppressor-like RCC1 family protein
MLRSVRFAVVLGVSWAAAGCGAGEPNGSDGDADSENVGRATFELSTIPTGVGCIRITVTGSSVVTKDFTMGAGTSSATLNMDRLPLGNIAVNGSAYAATCGTGDTLYLADAASATLSPGVITNLALTFRKDNPVNANVSFVGNVQAISAIWGTSLAVIDGNVYYWGQNNAVPANATSTTMIQVPGLSNVVDLSQGNNSTTPCAIKNDGTLWCWGHNLTYAAGSTTPQFLTNPIQVGTETGVAMAAGGYGFNLFAGPSNRFAKAVGSNGSGQLGDPTTAGSATATPVVLYGLSARSVAAGKMHSCIVNSNYGIACTGDNSDLQLGDGTSTNRTSLVTLATAPAKSVTAGTYSTCAAMTDGTAKCWGDNSSGQGGDGTLVTKSYPTTVSGLTGVNKLSAGGAHVCALLDNGSVKCWGLNSSGQLGDGTETNRSTPVPVVGIPDPVVQLSAGYDHTCAVTSKQDIYCWGANYSGQLGDGTYYNSVKPVKVKLP